jgi:pectate lyase
VTLDGGCSGIQIEGADGASVLQVLSRAQNIVIARVQLEKSGRGDPKADGDCITIGQFSDRVWVAYNALRRCGDGMIDITQSRPGDLPSRVTVAFNRFADHDKTMLVAAPKCMPSVGGACVDGFDLAWDWSRGVQVTLQGNVFLRTGQRHPRLYGSSYVHMLNNVIAFRPFRRSDGTFGASSGTFVGGGARALIQNNLYVPLDARRAHFAVSSAETPKVSHQENEGHGAMRVMENIVIGEATIDERHKHLVPNPPYTLRPRQQFGIDPHRAARCALQLSGPEAALALATPECRD